MIMRIRTILINMFLPNYPTLPEKDVTQLTGHLWTSSIAFYTPSSPW